MEVEIKSQLFDRIGGGSDEAVLGSERNNKGVGTIRMEVSVGRGPKVGGDKLQGQTEGKLGTFHFFCFSSA
jgi:hypothetical protein